MENTTDAPQQTTDAPQTTVPVQTTVPGVKVEDESSGVTVELPEELAGKLENAKLEANEEEAVSAAGVVESLRQHTSQVGATKVFQFRLTDNGVQVQPDGSVTVSLPVPQEWKDKNLRVYRVAEDGTVTDMGAQLSADGEHIRFQSDLTSHYVLAQVEEGSSLTWLWIVLAVVALAGGGAAGYFFWFKKRKTA